MLYDDHSVNFEASASSSELCFLSCEVTETTEVFQVFWRTGLHVLVFPDALAMLERSAPIGFEPPKISGRTAVTSAFEYNILQPQVMLNSFTIFYFT